MKIIGIIRERNEGNVLINCLKHALKLCDHILVYDDKSRQEDLELLKKFTDEVNTKAKNYFREDIYKPIITIFENNNWQKDREKEETRHRQFLLDKAREIYGVGNWIYCFDADEVLENPGILKMRIMISTIPKIHTAYSFRLFDAYITEVDQQDYINEPLWNFRKYFDYRCRDIIMLWLDSKNRNFVGLDRREPNIPMSQVKMAGYCQHYGKALSREKFNKKCDYYANHFPKYSKKWRERKDKFILGGNDKDFKVGKWEQVKKNYILIAK